MSSVISPAPYTDNPEVAAKLLVSLHDVRAVLMALKRDIQLADWGNRPAEIDYWNAVRTAVIELSGVTDWPKAIEPDIPTSVEEGIRLNRIFSRMRCAESHKELLSFAELLVRNEPI